MRLQYSSRYAGMFPTAVLSMEGGVTQELRTDGTYWVL